LRTPARTIVITMVIVVITGNKASEQRMSFQLG
jgi:hypothetical protein